MKTLSLFFILSVFAGYVHAQNNYPRHQKFPKAKYCLSEDVMFCTLEEYNSIKGGGDTIIYEDFNDSLPAGWTYTDLTGNNFDWRWDDNGPSGPYSSNIEPLQSTTGTNGFILYDGDAFDVATTKDAYIESVSMDLSSYSSVVIKFEHAFRHCCTGIPGFWLKVSTDDFQTESAYDVGNSMQNNVASGNPIVTELNITPVAAGQQNVKIRFHFDTNIAYYWMVDDILIKTAYDNELIMDQFYATFESQGFYSQIPKEHVHGVSFGAEVSNFGVNDQSNVRLNVDVKNDAGTTIHNGVSATPITLASLSEDSIMIEEFYNVPDIETGTYDFIITSLQDETDDNPGNNTSEISTEVTHYAYSRALFQNGQYFLNSDYDGNGLGVYYYITTDDTLHSVSALLSSWTTAGVKLIARVYADGDPPVEVIGSNVYTVEQGDPGNWITIPLISSGNDEEYVSEGWYIAFIEVYFEGGTFALARDASKFHDFSTSVLRVGDYWYESEIMNFITLNLYRTLYNDIADNITQDNIIIYPNPTDGVITIEANNIEQIEITDIKGKTIYLGKEDQIDIRKNPPGIYFLKITTVKGFMVQKVILE